MSFVRAHRAVWSCAVLANLVVAASACSADHGSAGTGSAEVIAVTSSALSTQADVNSLALTISGTGISPSITTMLAHAGTNFEGIIGGIPAGTERTFHGDGKDASGATIYGGDAAHVTIAKDQKALVALILQQLQKPDPFKNSAPELTSVFASTNTVDPSATVDLSATATDPDAADIPLLAFSWTTTGGSFTNGDTDHATFTAPAVEGPITITVRVRDAHGASAAASFVVNVKATGGTGSASVSASFNDAPTVTAVTIDQNPLAVGATAQLGATATDLDGDAIASWEWSSSCVGSFNDPASQNPTFTMTAETTDPSCTFTVKATDARGGWNTGTLSVAEGAPVTVTPGPAIDTTFQAADTVDGGQTLTFRAKGHDPSGGGVTYGWADDSGGTLGTAAPNANGESEVAWTAPACLAKDAHITVTVTSTTTAESTSQTFTVTPSANQTCAPPPPTTTSTEAIDLDANNGLAGATDNGGMSDDGQYVYFTSNSPTLPGANGFTQVYLRDRTAHQTHLVSRAFNGSTGVNANCTVSSVSADGRYSLISTTATNAIPSAMSGPPTPAYYFGDRLALPSTETGASPTAMFIILIPSPQPNLPVMVTNMHLSADGKTACFVAPTQSFAGGVPSAATSVFTMTIPAGAPQILSTGSVNDSSYDCALSQDGSVVAIATTEAIDPLDGNGYGDIYARKTLGPFILASGAFQAGASSPALSADGTHVAYVLGGEEVQVGSTSSAMTIVHIGVGLQPRLSADGRFVAYSGPDNEAAVVFDTTNQLAVVLSEDGQFHYGDGTSSDVFISGDGKLVTFFSTSSNLVSADTNNTGDVFIRSRVQ